MASVTGQTLPPILATTRICSDVVIGEGRDETTCNRQVQLRPAVNKQIMCVSVSDVDDDYITTTGANVTNKFD